MILLKLAIRNIFAHTSRSTVIFVVISLVTAILFAFLSFTDGEVENLKKSITSLQDPQTDLVIYGKGLMDAYDAYEPFDKRVEITIRDYQDLLAQIRGFEYVESAYVHTYPSNNLDIISKGKRYQGLNVCGIEYDDGEHLKSEVTVYGRFFESGDENVILMNSITKDSLHLSLNDAVTLTGTDFFGQTFVEELRIIGFYTPQVGHPEIDDLMFVDMKSYGLISGLYAGEAHRMHVNLKKGYSRGKALEQVSSFIQKENLEIEVIDGADRPGDGMGGVYMAVRIIFVSMAMIVLFIVMFGIMNVISVNLVDRKKEIGSYYCLGAEKPFLNAMYTLEILFLNFFSSLAGIGMGYILCLGINALNITTTDPGLQFVFGGNRFYLGFNMSTVVLIVASLLGITLFSAVTTLGSALKVSPSVAVREVEE